MKISNNYELRPSGEIHFHRPDRVKEPLYVICPIFNPKRYRSRWKLYKDFEEMVLLQGEAELITIEAAFGEREFVIEQSENPKHHVIRVVTSEEIWLKENMINIAISRLPLDWKYVAWIDGDISFVRPDWVGETIQQLQHYKFLQMFSQANDINSKYEVIQTHTGFMYSYMNGIDQSRLSKGNYNVQTKTGSYWHPGFAWAARREAIDNVGGLIDWSILGGGDTFMAYALVGRLNDRIMPRSLGQSGVRMLSEWQKRCEKYIKRNVGYVEGTVNHYWHGKRANRGYEDRGTILTTSRFEVDTDLKRDAQGLYRLNDDKFKLKEDIRAYFGRRNEDALSD